MRTTSNNKIKKFTSKVLKEKQRVPMIYKSIVHKICKKSTDRVFKHILEDREDDIIRCINARSTDRKRKERSNRLLQHYMIQTGTKDNAPELSKKNIDELKDTWSDIWDYGIIKPDWFKLYAYKTGNFDPTFIPDDLHYYYVEWNTIDYDYLRGFLDKNYLDIVLPDIGHPPVLIRKIHGIYLDKCFRNIGLEAAIDLIYMNRIEGAVIKVSVASSGGKGIYFVESSTTKENIRDALTNSRDIHVEKLVRQHQDMAIMNPSSINTVRIITMLIDGNPVQLSACVRVGNVGSKVDNVSSGGFACGIRPDGSLKEFAYSEKGDRTAVHPNGFRFSTGKVPNYEKIVEAVKHLHLCVPVFGVVSWDICIDPLGRLILIEYNVGMGQIDFHQYNNGPLYGGYRDKILSYVFKDFALKDGNLDYSFLINKQGVTIKEGSYHIVILNIPYQLSNKSVTLISTDAFRNRTNLEVVNNYADLEEIQSCAFYGCIHLKKFVFKGRVKKIGNSSFYACSDLVEIRLPEGTESIQARAFYDCKKLKRIYIPNSVYEIGEEVFCNCANLTIYANDGSFAAQFANLNNFRVKYT